MISREKRNLELKYKAPLKNYFDCLNFLSDFTNNYEYIIDERYSSIDIFEEIYLRHKNHLKIFELRPKYKYNKKEVKLATFCVYEESGKFVEKLTVFFKKRKWDYNYYD